MSGYRDDCLAIEKQLANITMVLFEWLRAKLLGRKVCGQTFVEVQSVSEVSGVLAVIASDAVW